MAQDVDWHAVGPRLLEALEVAIPYMVRDMAANPAWWTALGITEARAAIAAAKGETT